MSSLKQRKFIRDCIRLYRNLPALWDTSCKEYRNKDKKNEAYEKLLEKFRENYPEATRDDVRKRINILRTNFRKEVVKIENSAKVGGNYRPTLWYYDDFKFLIDDSPDDNNFIDDRTGGRNSTGERPWEASPLLAMNTVFKEEVHGSENSNDFSDYTGPPDIIFADCSDPENTSISIQPKKRKIIEHNEEHVTESPTCNKIHKCRHDFINDEYDAITLTWANDLRKMEKIQAIFARKAINDILMEGLLGNLQHNTENQAYLVPSMDHSFITPSNTLGGP